MEQQDLSLPMEEVGSKMLPFFLGSVLFTVIPYYLVWGTLDDGGFFKWYSMVSAFIIGIIIHEAIHGFTWVLTGNVAFSQIKYGVLWQSLTPYAHCKVPIRKRPYVIGAAMPLILLGIVPFIYAISTGNGWFFWFSVIFTSAAAGDMWIIWILRHIRKDQLVLDHPTNAGCLIYDKN